MCFQDRKSPGRKSDFPGLRFPVSVVVPDCPDSLTQPLNINYNKNGPILEILILIRGSLVKLVKYEHGINMYRDNHYNQY